MRDWTNFVRTRLRIKRLDRREEIIRELADHLEEAERDGNQDVQVPDWAAFSKEIRRAEEDIVRSRLRTLWVPGLISGVLATMALAIMQKAGLRPLVADWSAQPVTIYWPWLFTLPPIGAIAACLSRRAGGNVRTRLAAAAFPCVGLGVPTVIGGILVIASFLTASDRALLAMPVVEFTAVWIALPAACLVLGALPFLSAHKAGDSQRASAAGA